MAISIKNLHTRKPTRPFLGLIYGEPGIGKTSLAAEFPNPIFLQAEDAEVNDVELCSFTQDRALADYTELSGGIDELYNQDHDFKTVVVDAVDAVENFVWIETCRRNQWASIESPGYGKGYIAAEEVWREFLSSLEFLRADRGMNVVLIGHAEIERFDDPQNASYSRYDFRLHKRAHALLEDSMYAVLFLNQDATIKEEDQGFGRKRSHAEGGGQIWIHANRRPAYNAKNRYGMPDRLLFKKGAGFKVIEPYLPDAAKLPAPQPAKKAKAA